MLNLFKNKKINAFGLKISDVSVKTMQLKPTPHGFFPHAFSEVALPIKTINNHAIANEAKLADYILRAVAKAGKIDTKYVVASVPEAKSFVRIVKIPKMDEREIDSAVPYELEQDIPVPVDQVYLDWQPIGETPDGMELLVTATTKDYVDSLISVLSQIKLKPVALELESQATARAIIGREDIKEAILIVDISTAQTSFIIVDNGNMQYTSSIPAAGSAFTESIGRNLGVPQDEAEKLKRANGLMNETKKGNIRQAILPIIDNIVDEIKNVLRFQVEHSKDKRPVSKIYLCGGGSKLLGIDEYISARLNLGTTRPIGQVRLGNPWVNILNDDPKRKIPLSKEEALNYASVIGLALRGADYEQQ
jgi:type IV pilus assembly protein PilM